MKKVRKGYAPSPINAKYRKERINNKYALNPILTSYRIWRIYTDMNGLARDPKQIGNVIRRVRKRQGLSQAMLGRKAGLRQESISLLENGNAAAKIQTILAVLSALDLELQIAPRSKGDFDIESES